MAILLTFTCKGRHFCPSCYQHRVRSTSDWIATAVCQEAPIANSSSPFQKSYAASSANAASSSPTSSTRPPKPSATPSARASISSMGKHGAIAGVHTFGDYLIFHPHHHVLTAPRLLKINNHQSEILLIRAPPKQSAREMRPLLRDLILKTWGGDPLQCPCCKGTMKPVRKVIRREEIQFFLRIHGLWEGIVTLTRPPPPPFDIETMEPIEPPWQAIKEWIPDDEPDLDWFNRPRNPHFPALRSDPRALSGASRTKQTPSSPPPGRGRGKTEMKLP